MNVREVSKAVSGIPKWISEKGTIELGGESLQPRRVKKRALDASLPPISVRMEGKVMKIQREERERGGKIGEGSQRAKVSTSFTGVTKRIVTSSLERESEYKKSPVGNRRTLREAGLFLKVAPK